MFLLDFFDVFPFFGGVSVLMLVSFNFCFIVLF